MPEAFRQSEPSLLSTERPCCLKCAGRMMLARIERGPNQSDLRTFECPKCEYVKKVMVEDPMKSVRTRWQDSGLRRPE